MALFPKCEFQVLLPNGSMTPGATLDGVLVLKVPEPIPRADHIDLYLRSQAVAGYGSGKSRSVLRRDMFVAPMRVDLPHGQPLPQGEYRYPFRIDIPAWIPPAYLGSDCSITHSIDVRLDVDWAIDPKTSVTPIVLLQGREAYARPVTTRSPHGFHESIVVDVTLDSSVYAHDGQLSGRIALRGGHQARFDAIKLSMLGRALILMGRGDVRMGGGNVIRISADRLRSSEAVPFAFPPSNEIYPTFKNGFIDHDVVLQVEVDIPWGFDPSFEIPLELLPRGSRIIPLAGAHAGPVGMERLNAIAAAMAQATGSPPTIPPLLLDGKAGPVAMRVTDGPRAGRLGVDAQLTFPDVELGTLFRPLGMLEGFRQSPLLPTGLQNRYLLRVEPEKEQPNVPEDALASFYATVLGGLDNADEVLLTDHSLNLHFALANDGSELMVQIAQLLHQRAKALGDAIAQLPFAVPDAKLAWTQTAGEQSAFLVPSGPALHGLQFNARVLTGETRTMGAALVTRWNPLRVVCQVDLRSCPLPKSAWMETEKPDVPGLRGVRAMFPTIHAHTVEKIDLETAAWVADPRTLLSAIEQFFSWVLETRGERRVDSPYR